MSHTHTCHTGNQLWLYVWHTIYLKIFLSDFDQGIFLPMLLITYQTLKEEKVYIHAAQGIWVLQNLEEVLVVCDTQYLAM